LEAKSISIWRLTWTCPLLKGAYERWKQCRPVFGLVKGSNSRAGEHINYETASLVRDLEQLAREVSLMKEGAYAAGDHRLALACIRSFVEWVSL